MAWRFRSRFRIGSIISWNKTKNMKSIYNNGYRVGNRNAYGVGVYCSPNIETAAEYSDEFYGYNGKKYKIFYKIELDLVQ